MTDRNREIFDQIERGKLDEYYNNVPDDAKYNPWTDPDRDYNNSKEDDK